MTDQKNIRNIAIIAHVDHGKTTLVDEMLKQGGIYRENQAVVDRVMDSGDLERERGITILAKNTAVHYKGTKINIVDTPGHADFGGEVERILKMVNGVLLLVDAAEGPMPQTRFVLQKALELGHKVIVVVNKIDRLDARVEEVMDEVLELLLDLNATDEQFESPTLFCSARQGIASYSPNETGVNLDPLFDTIVNYIPAPEGDPTAPMQMLVSSIDYNDYVGRIGIGRVERGTVRVNQEVAICDYHDPSHSAKGKIVALYEFDGLGKNPIQEAGAGEIVAFSGMADITIGRTICAPEQVEPYIRSCGFYHGKARDLVWQAQRITEVYGGKVPDNMDDLLTLPGVGRKSANLILGDVFRQPGAVVVDTHCIRLSNRLGLVDNDKDPVRIEKALRAVLPPEKSNDFCHRLVLHGRAVCAARKPLCDICCCAAYCKTLNR